MRVAGGTGAGAFRESRRGHGPQSAARVTSSSSRVALVEVLEQHADGALGAAGVKVADRPVGAGMAEPPTDLLGGINQDGRVGRTVRANEPVDTFLE